MLFFLIHAYSHFRSWVCRDKDVACSVQSLRIISNLVAVRAIVSVGLIEKITCALLDFTDALVGMKSSEFNKIIPKVNSLDQNVYHVFD